jgi:hypothetical protein
MRMPRLSWRPRTDIIVLIVLALMLFVASRLLYRPHIVKNSPYWICIRIDEQIPPFHDYWLTFSPSDGLHFN